MKVVKYLVKKVTQFPSDQECYNYIQSIKDKDPELRMRCAQCVETIITAKERQEKEANKHADALLREIENDKQRKIKKKETKKRKKETKKKPDVKSESDINGGNDLIEEIDEHVEMTKKQEEKQSPITTPTPPKEGKKSKKKLRVDQNKVDDFTSGSITPEKTKSIDSGTPPATRVPTIPTGSPESEDPADKALKSMMEPVQKDKVVPLESISTSKRDQKREAANKRRSNKGETPQSKTLEFVNTELKNDLKEKANVVAAVTEVTGQVTQAVVQEEKLGWDVVKTKKPIRKLVLPSGQIARVIGRSGCNVNAIRDVTGTHIVIVMNFCNINIFLCCLYGYLSHN